MTLLKLVAALAITLAFLNANAQVSGTIDSNPYQPDRQPSQPPNRSPNRPPNPGYQQEHKVIQLNRYFRDEALPLRQLLGIGQQYQGALVQSVEVRLQDSGRSSLTLTADNLIVSQENRLNPSTVLIPYRQLKIGENAKALQLNVRGKLMIYSVAVNLLVVTNPGHGQTLEKAIYRNFYGPNRLDLMAMMNLMQFQGYRLVSISIEGAGLGQQGGSIRALANGFDQGTVFFSSPRIGQQVINLRGAAVIGRDVSSMILATNGQLQINRIQILVTR